MGNVWVDVLIGINTRVLGGLVGSKISTGQSGGGLLGQLGPISLFFNIKHIYFFISYAFRFPLTNLFIYSLNYLFLNLWYFFIHKFNWFPQSKILCVFESSFCSFGVRARLCVSVTYLHVYLHTPLSMLPFCSRLLYACNYVDLYICTSVCFCIYNIV